VEHAPFEHTWPAGHFTPQPPQLASSVFGFAQYALPGPASAPHRISFIAQVAPHPPLEQTWPPGHACSQAPQFLLSLLVFVHVPLHDFWPMGHIVVASPPASLAASVAESVGASKAAVPSVSPPSAPPGFPGELMVQPATTAEYATRPSHVLHEPIAVPSSRRLGSSVRSACAPKQQRTHPGHG